MIPAVDTEEAEKFSKIEVTKHKQEQLLILKKICNLESWQIDVLMEKYPAILEIQHKD